MVYSQDFIMYERLSLYLDDLVQLVSTLLHQFMDIVLFHLILGYPIISKWNGYSSYFSSKVVLYSKIGKAWIIVWMVSLIWEGLEWYSRVPLEDDDLNTWMYIQGLAQGLLLLL